jgi:CDP-diacylglycerol---serine O-phosphatidyltransferase
MRNLRYLVPNAFTAASLCLGLASVTQAAAGRFELAAWMILWAVLLDNVDGASARLLGAGTEFGEQMDSFADLVSFGVAPAALVFYGAYDLPFWSSHPWMLGVTCGIHVLANASRLARFNIQSSPRGAGFYQGLTTTLCGAILASLYLVCARGSLPTEWIALMPVLLLALALLMVSRLPFPKLRRRGNLWVDGLQVVNGLAIYVLGPLRMFPEYLLALALLYPLLGISWAWMTGAGRTLESHTEDESEDEMSDTADAH